jgi:tetratricopeptide (TPR) repeat protein
MKSYEEGIESFRNAIDLDERHAKSHYNLGKCLDDAKLHSEAQKSYNRAYELDPTLFENV